MKNAWMDRVKKKQLAHYTENVNVPKQGNMNEEYTDKLGVVVPKHRAAFLAENQRLANELALNKVITDEWLHGVYDRVSVAAVQKAFDPANFLMDNIVSVQPMGGPGGKVKFLRFRYTSPKKTTPSCIVDNGDGTCSISTGHELNDNADLPEISLHLEDEDCLAKTRFLKMEFPLTKPVEAEGLRHYYGDFYLTKDFSEKYPEVKEYMEEEMVSYVSNSLTNEIQAEILTDLRNNAGTIAKWDFASVRDKTVKEKYEALYIKIVEVSGVIHRKTLRGGCNWIVTSPEIASIFTTATSTHYDWKERNDFEMCYHGTMNGRWRLYTSKTAIPKNTMLLGYKGDSPYDSGYFYNPYIPLTPVEKTATHIGTLSRYSKKLLREGAKFYARINVEGFDE